MEKATFTQRLRSQGRIVVPAMVRHGLELEVGEEIVVSVYRKMSI
jgi:AbrB family looped-hinge helix DNA binding protein